MGGAQDWQTPRQQSVMCIGILYVPKDCGKVGSFDIYISLPYHGLIWSRQAVCVAANKKRLHVLLQTESSCVSPILISDLAPPSWPFVLSTEYRVVQLMAEYNQMSISDAVSTLYL